jgi:predicted MFS family arabinose efflux permease
MKKFNKAIRILLVTNGLILVAGAMFGPIYAIFVEKIGGSLLDASYAFGVFAFVAGTVTLLSGKYADKIRENELILVVGYGAIGVGFLGYIFVNSIFSLLIVQVIIGFGEAIYGPAFDVIYAKHLDKKNVGRDWGAYGAIDYFTTTIGAVTGGVLVTLFGFNVIFIAMGLLCFASAGYILFLPRITL